jgi:hypothetical protein
MTLLAAVLLVPIAMFALARWSLRDRCPWCRSSRTAADGDGLRRCVDCEELYEPW